MISIALIYITLGFVDSLTTTCETVTNVLGVDSLIQGKFFDINKKLVGHYLFYQSPSQNDQLMVFVGPPGQTSQNLNFRGVGPIQVNNSGQMEINPYSILNATNLLYLDLLGAGYSELQVEGDLYPLYFGGLISDSVRQIQNSCLNKTYRIHLASYGTGAKGAVFAASDLEANLVLIAPLLESEQLVRQLPEFAQSRELIGKTDRIEVERMAFNMLISGYDSESYSQLVNRVAKLAGDLNIHNFGKVGTDVEQILLSKVFNDEQTRDILKIDGQFQFSNPQTFRQFQHSFSYNDSSFQLANYLSTSKTTSILLTTFSLYVNLYGSVNTIEQLYFKSNGKQVTFAGQPTMSRIDKTTLELLYTWSEIDKNRLYTVIGGDSIDPKKLQMILLQQVS